MAGDVGRLAREEGLPAHARAAALRGATGDSEETGAGTRAGPGASGGAGVGEAGSGAAGSREGGPDEGKAP